MDIDITHFFRTAGMIDYSASIAEIGPDAAKLTWGAAVKDSDEYSMLDTEDKRDAFREFIKGFGAWSEEEVAAWSERELNALFIQFVAGDIRESQIDTEEPDWKAYANDFDGGMRFFPSGDQIYYHLGC